MAHVLARQRDGGGPLVPGSLSRGRRAAMVVLLVVGSVAVGAHAPRLPRTPDGKPDMNGVWQALNTAAWDIQDHSAAWGVPAGQTVVDGNEIPYLPDALEKKARNFATRGTADPLDKCYLPGVPRATYLPFPFHIVQRRKHVGIAYEFAHATRTIFVDGSQHPEGDIDFWMGDSRGRWEGDTLVVDVANLNAETWFDRAGNHHSGALHVIERYTMKDANHIEYEATIEDPKTFSRSWTMRMPLYRRLDRHAQVLEYECVGLLERERASGGR